MQRIKKVYQICIQSYVPTVDYGVLPDIPVRNFLYMAELIKAIAEGTNPDKVTIDRYNDILGEWSMELPIASSCRMLNKNRLYDQTEIQTFP